MVPIPSRSGRQAPAVPRIRQVELEPTQIAKQYGADIRVLRLADRRLLRMLRRVRLIAWWVGWSGGSNPHPQKPPHLGNTGVLRHRTIGGLDGSFSSCEQHGTAEVPRSAESVPVTETRQRTQVIRFSLTDSWWTPRAARVRISSTAGDPPTNRGVQPRR